MRRRFWRRRGRLAEAVLTELGRGVLTTADARGKAARAREAAALWRAARASGAARLGEARPPDRPARPERPELLDPRAMPRRGRGAAAGRVALLHSVAHIELNAIDLHWDMAVRFAALPLPLGFFDDWAAAADDEAKHFCLVADRLEALGSAYGALPAHDGMWRAAEDTADDLLARLAVVPMVMEARGIDVTPGMVASFEAAGDAESAAALRVISAEEVVHVAYGAKWFNFLCGRAGLDPKPTFHDLVRRRLPGGTRPPFDAARRAEAGLPPDFYLPLVGGRSEA